VAVNPLTGLGVVANETTNAATIIDLNTRTVVGTVSGVGTGPRPRAVVEPRLDWGIITPGGGGTLSIVDLGRSSVVATVSLGQSVRGIGINTETDRAFLVDPSSPSATIFSVLDQSVATFSLQTGQVAAAVNSLTDVGVSVNSTTNQAYLVDLRTPTLPATTVAVGAGPVAVDIDPGRNRAVIANETDGTVSILSLGNIRTPHITQINPATLCVTTAAPAAGCVAAADTTLTVTGFGFLAGATVRLDGMALATTVVSGRQLTATFPAAMQASPRRYALDVENGPGGPLSNVSVFTVIQAVAVGTTPRGVTIDAQRNLALVANSGSDNVSFVNLTTGTVTQTVAVSASPQAVAVFSRSNRGVVTNRLSNRVTLLDLDAATSVGEVSTGAEPTGVAINNDTGQAVVANLGDNSVTILDVVAGTVAATVAVDARPVAVAIDPTRSLAAVASETGNSVSFIALTVTNPSVSFRTTGLQLPTGVTFDPVSERFLAVASLSNNLIVIDPDTGQLTQARVGINPTSLAYNFNSSTLVTLNTASQTISVMDFLTRRIRAILPISGTDRYALAIHPRTNLAVVSDATNNRILLVPLPR
jgi:YVTN family beta-propeller protein